MEESKGNCRGEVFKIGDEVTVLDGREIGDPNNIVWIADSESSMTASVGKVGKITVLTPHNNTTRAQIEGTGCHCWYDVEWLARATIPFDVDTFTEYLKSDV